MEKPHQGRLTGADYGRDFVDTPYEAHEERSFLLLHDLGQDIRPPQNIRAAPTPAIALPTLKGLELLGAGIQAELGELLVTGRAARNARSRRPAPELPSLQGIRGNLGLGLAFLPLSLLPLGYN
jgi:hypothetical protein